MDKTDIGKLLITNHHKFVETITSVPDAQFELQPNGKWSTGQQLEHIIKSVTPVDTAFGLPRFVLKMKFGLSNRKIKSYDELVKQYLKVLDDNRGYVLPKRFAPDTVEVKSKNKKLDQLKKLVDSLVSRLSKYPEKEFDELILPHPVMGKLTLREILFFTAYHAEHHDKHIIPNINTMHNAKS